MIIGTIMAVFMLVVARHYNIFIYFFLISIFLYKRINILDTRLLWGNNYSREEIKKKI